MRERAQVKVLLFDEEVNTMLETAKLVMFLKSDSPHHPWEC
jgi:hypothetical protein